MTKYLVKKQGFVDKMAASSHLVSHEKQIEHILNGLSPEYESFVTSISTRPGDSEASNHITPDINNLAMPVKYGGTNKILVGNGQGLTITHSGSNSNVSPWHQHLGHSSMKVVESLLSNCKVQVQEESPTQNFDTLLPTDPHISTLSTHPMQTHSKLGIFKPRALVASVSSTTKPNSHIQALHIPEWTTPMQEKYNTLLCNNTWSLVPLPPNQSVIGFHHNWPLDKSTSIMPSYMVISPIVTRNNNQLISKSILIFITNLHSKIWASFITFLGLNIYIEDLLTKTRMIGATPIAISCFTSFQLSQYDGTLLENATMYRSTVGALQYLTISRPEIAFVVSKVNQFMHKSTDLHWKASKRLLRYLKGTMHYGLFITLASQLDLVAYSDVDWASNPDDRKSTSGCCIYLGSSLVSWGAKKQSVVSHSSTESECR
ncbi:hypothetical protein AAG906_017911 [Vitis piasezkii]